MEPLNLQDFENKVQQPKVEENQDKKTQSNVSAKNHREIVLNNINMMMKWAYDNK
ncbi:MAG: hypothetical protein HF967_05085 [Methanosarcinales archaeon]|nr:hypothetical protein [Methanosarcinales archaeon]